MSLDNSAVTMNDLVKQRQQSRADAEPIKPTEETIDLDVSPEEEIEQEIENLEAHINEPEEEATPLEEVTGTEELYVTIDDKELSFSEIRELQQGNMRQADYTRKTQDVAEGRKTLESDQEAFKTKSLQLDGLVDQLEVMVEDFETKDFDGYTLDELRENDPGEYIKQTELQKARKSKLKEIEDTRAGESMIKQKNNAEQQLSVLAEKNGWINEGQPTEAYTKDTEAVKKYLDHLGMSESEQKGILLSGHGQVYIERARQHIKSKVNSAISKKVRKAPVVSKPGGQQTSTQQNALEIAIANHKKLGTVDSGVALRVAKRNSKK